MIAYRAKSYIEAVATWATFLERDIRHLRRYIRRNIAQGCDNVDWAWMAGTLYRDAQDTYDILEKRKAQLRGAIKRWTS